MGTIPGKGNGSEQVARPESEVESSRLAELSTGANRRRHDNVDFSLTSFVKRHFGWEGSPDLQVGNNA